MLCPQETKSVLPNSLLEVDVLDADAIESYRLTHYVCRACLNRVVQTSARQRDSLWLGLYTTPGLTLTVHAVGGLNITKDGETSQASGLGTDARITHAMDGTQVMHGLWALQNEDKAWEMKPVAFGT